jgi:hypothetical protein
MATKSAPAQATQQEELPKTAVKPRQKDILLQQMSDKIAELEGNTTSEPTNEPNEVENTEEGSFKKRYGDLRRHMQQKEASFTREIDELKLKISQLDAASRQPMPKTREEFETWKSTYPDIVGFIEIIAEERTEAAKKQLQEELGNVKDKLSETEKEKAFATLKVLVPDLESIIGSAPYKKWFADQPHFIQEILDTSDDPHQIAYYMNVYKATTAPAVIKPKRDKLDALEVGTRGTGATPSVAAEKYKYTQSQIAKMSPAEFEANEADIIAARNAGKIFDDVSRRNTVFDMT